MRFHFTYFTWSTEKPAKFPCNSFILLYLLWRTTTQKNKNERNGERWREGEREIIRYDFESNDTHSATINVYNNNRNRMECLMSPSTPDSSLSLCGDRPNETVCGCAICVPRDACCGVSTVSIDWGKCLCDIWTYLVHKLEITIELLLLGSRDWQNQRQCKQQPQALHFRLFYTFVILIFRLSFARFYSIENFNEFFRSFMLLPSHQ